MESLVLSVNVTLPLFIMMALGYFLKRVKLVDDALISKVNALNFKVFLPLMMFNNLCSANISAVWDGTTAAIAAVSSPIIFLASIFIVPKLIKVNGKRGVVVQSMYHSNYSYIGIPVAMSICGSASAGISAIVLAIISPINNALSTINYELFRGGKARASVILKRILLNPLIIASVLGITGMLLKITFPFVIQRTIDDLSKLCTPLALIALGGSFDFKSLTGNFKLLTFSSAVRLIAIPAVFFAVSVAFGVRGESLAAIFALFATPVAVVSYTLAQMMDGDAVLSGQMIIVQSCASIITMFMWVFILNSFGLF